MATPAVAWFEVTGKDGARLQSFYRSLFEWQIQDAGDGYGLVAAAEKGIGGGIGAAQDGDGGHVSFKVSETSFEGLTALAGIGQAPYFAQAVMSVMAGRLRRNDARG